MPLAVIKFTEEQSDDVLEDFAEEVRIGIAEYLNEHTRGTGRTADSIRAHVYGKEIVVESDVPWAKVLDEGSFDSRVMWHLINQVVPIKLEGGRTIFRKVTLESIQAGGWRKKPQVGLDFVRKGIERARSRTSLRAQLDYVVEKPTD
jgi:hypothetical protein